VTAERRSLFQVTATAELLVKTILDYRTKGKFLLHAFVIMPDHFHALQQNQGRCIPEPHHSSRRDPKERRPGRISRGHSYSGFALITPAPDVSLEKAMQFIKGGFSFRPKSKLDVWMRSFNESQILSQEKFLSCVRYIEENPVRRGLVSTSEEYPFSSAIVKPSDPMPVHFGNSGSEARA
jgi:putative transposase